MAMIISQTNFVSRNDVEYVREQVNAAFSDAAEDVADRMDAMTYRAIVNLHAAIAFYLSETGRPRPRMMSYRFNRPMTTLTVAYRLYADASRADEIRYENKVIHPAFARQEGVALAS
jgi:prophage DNA circulation protein